MASREAMKSRLQILAAALLLLSLFTPVSSFTLPHLPANLRLANPKHSLSPSSAPCALRPSLPAILSRPVCADRGVASCMVASSTKEMSMVGNGAEGAEPESFEVKADDGHPIKVWAKGPEDGTPVVLLHGRTWSARPVWDLQVEGRDGASELGASTMDLMASHKIRTYAPDMRGLGGTERDEPGYTTPKRCAKDVECVMEWLKEEKGVSRPLMVGWSQGGVVAHLYAQDHCEELSGVVLYASIFDPAPSEVVEHPAEPPVIMNTWEGAMEDWTIPGIIDDAAAEAYGHDALKWDPRKVSWKDVHEFDACDPAKLTLPTLVIHGEKDTYTDMEKQRSLFMGVACGDKAWRVVANADHPVHLYPKQRKVWMSAILSFMEGL